MLAANLEALIAEAQRVDGIIEFVPRVGDFVALGEPLFLLRGGAAAIPDSKLRGQVAFGSERTIEQDSTFAFRIIVDIAIKALSKAINDPTTAIVAIDQLHRLLRTAGKRHLHNDTVFDQAGRLRVIFPTPDWDDFVQLAYIEIRLYGAEHIVCGTDGTEFGVNWTQKALEEAEIGTDVRERILNGNAAAMLARRAAGAKQQRVLA